MESAGRHALLPPQLCTPTPMIEGNLPRAVVLGNPPFIFQGLREAYGQREHAGVFDAFGWL